MSYMSAHKDLVMMDPTPVTHKALTVLSAGGDLERRRLYLIGEIEPSMAARFIVNFDVLNQTNGPITIILNSPGGSVPDGFAIYDAIRLSPNPVHIVAIGEAESIAALILQAGDKRIMTQNCRFMIHDVSTSLGDQSLDGHRVRSLGGELDQLLNDIVRVLATRSNNDPKKVRAMCRKETFMSADEAKNHNFIDEVVRESNVRQARYEQWAASQLDAATKAIVAAQPKREKKKAKKSKVKRKK